MNENNSPIDLDNSSNQNPDDSVEISNQTADNEEQHILPTLADVYEKIQEHEMLHTVRYVVAFKRRMETDIDDIVKKKHKIYFENKDLPYTGVPFLFSSSSTLDCHQGKDKNVSAKALYLKRRNEDAATDGSCKRKRNILYDSKKVDCPAKIFIKEVIEFPEYKMNRDSVWMRKETSRKLRVDLTTKGNVLFCRKYILLLPDISSHKNHAIGDAIRINSKKMAKNSYKMKTRLQKHSDVEKTLPIILSKSENLLDGTISVEVTQTPSTSGDKVKESVLSKSSTCYPIFSSSSPDETSCNIKNISRTISVGLKQTPSTTAAETTCYPLLSLSPSVENSDTVKNSCIGIEQACVASEANQSVLSKSSSSYPIFSLLRSIETSGKVKNSCIGFKQTPCTSVIETNQSILSKSSTCNPLLSLSPSVGTSYNIKNSCIGVQIPSTCVTETNQSVLSKSSTCNPLSLAPSVGTFCNIKNSCNGVKQILGTSVIETNKLLLSKSSTCNPLLSLSPSVGTSSNIKNSCSNTTLLISKLNSPKKAKLPGETKETIQWSNSELHRVVLLEQLKYYRLKCSKYKKESNTPLRHLLEREDINVDRNLSENETK